MSSDSPLPLRGRLRTALVAAMKDRDRVTVAALRSALAAIDNAEAVEPSSTAGARTIVGVGITDVERRALSDADISRIVRSEVANRQAAALEYDRVGRAERAEVLRAEARILASHL